MPGTAHALRAMRGSLAAALVPEEAATRRCNNTSLRAARRHCRFLIASTRRRGRKRIRGTPRHTTPRRHAKPARPHGI
ncbi:hypothetical protein WS68_18125 [Burkholderia sp. TSV86]|nr:hypothetical protein WS68_18125 [Burkholderia sp. TSV86]